MAAEMNSENQKVFRHSDGSEIVFFMRPCNERQELKPLIEKGGGKVTSKVIQNCIKLAEKGSLVSSEGYYSTKFVEDSVTNGKLMDLEMYKITSGTRVRHTSDESEKSHLSFGSNDSLSPAEYVKPLQNKDLKGRSKYTLQEDVAMMKYLIDTNSYTQAGGIRVWKDMEMMKITSHTAQSMSARFRKTIVPNIEKYRDHIDKHWIPRLTGSLQQAASTSEFSPGALFQKRPLKKCQPDSTTESRKETTSTSDNKHQMKSLHQKDILQMFEGDDETSVTNTARRKRELVPLEMVLNSKRQKLQGQSNTEKIAENSKDSVSVDKQKGEKKHSETESSSEVRLKLCTFRALNLSEHNKNDNNNETADENEDEPIIVLEGGRLTKQGDDDHSNASAILDDQDVSIQSPDEDNSEFSEELLSLSNTNKTKKTINGGYKSSKQCASVDSYVTANSKPHTVSVNKPKPQNVATISALEDMVTDSLDMDIASSPDEVYLSAEEETQEPDSQGVEKDVEIVPDDDDDDDDASDDDDSFDKMLVPDNGGDEEDEDDDDDSFDEMLLHCGKEAEKESSCSSLGKKSNGKNINKQIDVETENQMKNSVGKSSGNELSPHRSSSNKAGSSKSALVEDKGKRSLPHRKEVDSCIEFCKRLGAELGLQAASVNRVLHQCSGDTVRTEAYLKYGPKSKELPPWTEDEDEELLSNRNSRKLRKKFGENDMEDRYQFLTEK